jgi:hypothetical protein
MSVAAAPPQNSPQNASETEVAPESAVFTVYYGEAYTEIVRPERWDWYLVTRWLPNLGALGFAIVKALRSKGYYNPKKGICRNQFEMDMAELARMTGVNKATIYREFDRNKVLEHFVSVQNQYIATGDGRAPKRCLPSFAIRMDEPIHPGDMAEYERLVREKEAEKARATAGQGAPKSKYRTKPDGSSGTGNPPKSQSATKGNNGSEQPETPKSQSATKGGSKSQSANPESQIANPQSQPATDTPIYDSVPSGGFTYGSYIPTENPDPPINSPEGEEESPDDVSQAVSASLQDSELSAAWAEVLLSAREHINKPSMETHIRPLQVLSLDRATGIVEILTNSSFMWEWVGKRYSAILETALSEALDQPIKIDLILPKEAEQNERPH